MTFAPTTSTMTFTPPVFFPFEKPIDQRTNPGVREFEYNGLSYVFVDSTVNEITTDHELEDYFEEDHSEDWDEAECFLDVDGLMIVSGNPSGEDRVLALVRKI